MTLIENDSPKVQYTGPFIKGQLLPLTFPYIATEDVKMIIDDTPAIFNVDYEIITEPNDEHPVAYPNSAYIKSDLPNAKQITLYRVTPLDQQAPFPQQSKFRSERVEQALDKLTMQQQEQEEQLSRCIIAPITLETFNGQLPAPAADQALKWNTDGTELENYDIIGEQEAFETDINTRFEEQSTTIENRIGQFEEETNTQFSEFRNEINENLEAVLNAAAQLEKLDTAVQSTENAAERANQSALSAQNSAQSAQEAIAIIDTKSSETIENINDIKTEAITNVELVADMGKQEIQDLVDEMKDNADIIINRVGLNMFDTVVKDHILTYEESRGLALQGTYVYKNAIAGESYGYPDFYAKCLEEFAEATEIVGGNWTRPNLSSNGTMGGDSFAVSSNRVQLSGNDVYRAFDGVTSGGNYFHTESGTKTGHIDIYNPVPINITGFTIYNQTGTANRASSAGIIYGSDNGSDWTQITTYTNSVQTAGGTWNISLSSNSKYYNYYRIESTAGGSDSYWTINEIKISATQQVGVKNPNGHLFYDISQKDQVDEVFNSTGMAWMYGVDEENERIFLPRNVWFEQMSMDDVGKAIEAGLPNITGTIDDVRGSAGGTTSSSGAIYWASSSNSWRNTVAEGNSGGSGISINASRSNPIYGNSDTVQPNAVKKLLYICVGNTVSDTSWVDVVTQVQEGTKDIQEAKDEAIEAMKNVTGGTVPLGFIGSAILGIDETLNLQRYLNGQIIIQDQFKGFTKFLKRRIELYPSLACAEDEWQTTVTMSAFSQCGKFVIDDNAGTIRLPKVVNIQGLTDLSKLGEIVEAGLPTHTHTRGSMNITGAIAYHSWHNVSYGAFYTDANVDNTKKAGTSNDGKAPESGATFDASRTWTGSTSTGNYSKALATTNTVQQEQIQYPYFIQVATGAETEDNIINEIELNNPFSLLDYKYSEYELNNLSWLRSNGQWNSKAVYPAVYDLLLKIYNGTEAKAGVSVKLSTETFTDYDFVLNTADETFMLPTKVKLASGKAVVGNGMALGLSTNTGISMSSGVEYLHSSSASTRYLLGTPNYTTPLPIGSPVSGTGVDTDRAYGVSINPEKSGIETSSLDLYLYFYVGETAQNANLINAGRIEEKVASLIPDNSSLIAEYGMNSGVMISLTPAASGTWYTAPANGIVRAWGYKNTSQNNYINIYTDKGGAVGCYIPQGWDLCNLSIRVAKGEKFQVTDYNDISSARLNFYYLKSEV